MFSLLSGVGAHNPQVTVRYHVALSPLCLISRFCRIFHIARFPYACTLHPTLTFSMSGLLGLISTLCHQDRTVMAGLLFVCAGIAIYTTTFGKYDRVFMGSQSGVFI